MGAGEKRRVLHFDAVRFGVVGVVCGQLVALVVFVFLQIQGLASVMYWMMVVAVGLPFAGLFYVLGVRRGLSGRQLLTQRVGGQTAGQSSGRPTIPDCKAARSALQPVNAPSKQATPHGPQSQSD